MNRDLLPPLRAYVIAVLLVVAAGLVRLALEPALKSHGPFLIFVLAVAGASWLGGWRPGLLAAVLSAIVGTWFFAEPRFEFSIHNSEDWVYLAVFLAESVVFCVLAVRLRNAQHDRELALVSERAARDRAESAADTAVAELALRRATEQELKRSNHDLERFAFVVSHDMREPLRTIRTDALEIAQHPETAASLAWKLVAATDRVQVLISDLLAYARVDQVNLISDSPVRIADVVMWIKANLATAIQESSAQITAGELPSVLVEFGALSQVLQNLVSNAIQYRGPDAPRIHITAAEDGDFYTISVEDNGIGIDPRHAEIIFTAFKRLHGNELPGTGIGLSICRRIVERLGGSIRVEPAPSQGSVFRFTIPVRLVAEMPRQAMAVRG